MWGGGGSVATGVGRDGSGGRREAGAEAARWVARLADLTGTIDTSKEEHAWISS